MSQNLNRVDHVVWIANAATQADRVDELSKMFKAEFLGPWDNVPLGIRIYVSWESGLEVVAPIEGDTPAANNLRKRLEERGEGLFAVVVGVPDIHEARQRAADLGYSPSPIIESTGQEPWLHKLKSFNEVIFTEFLGTLMVYGAISYADGVLEKGQTA